MSHFAFINISQINNPNHSLARFFTAQGKSLKPRSRDKYPFSLNATLVQWPNKTERRMRTVLFQELSNILGHTLCIGLAWLATVKTRNGSCFECIYLRRGKETFTELSGSSTESTRIAGRLNGVSFKKWASGMIFLFSWWDWSSTNGIRRKTNFSVLNVMAFSSMTIADKFGQCF